MSIPMYRIFEPFVFVTILCSVLFSVLLGIVVYTWKCRRQLTGSEKVRGGECIHGWRLVRSKASICKVCKQNRCIGRHWIVPPWNTLRVTADANTSFNSMSIFISTIHILPNGLKVFELRQRSLIIDDVFRTVWQLEHYNEWSFCQATHLTPRVIAIVFKQLTAVHFRVILVDIVTRVHRMITMESPTGDALICGLRQGAVERNTLQMVFARVIGIEGNSCLEFMVASYEIPSEGEIDTFPVKPQSRKSMTFPLRHAFGLLCIGDGGGVAFNPMTFILYYDIEQAGPDHRIFTLDESNEWRVDSVESWVASLQSSPYTASILAAAESICQLSVPNPGFRYFPPSVRHLKSLVPHHVGGAVFYMTPTHGVFQRFVSPPTLKRLAAEALLKSKVPLDHSMLKQLSGVDIFDGMMDKDEGTVPVIDMR